MPYDLGSNVGSLTLWGGVSQDEFKQSAEVNFGVQSKGRFPKRGSSLRVIEDGTVERIGPTPCACAAIGVWADMHGLARRREGSGDGADRIAEDGWRGSEPQGQEGARDDQPDCGGDGGGGGRPARAEGRS